MPMDETYFNWLYEIVRPENDPRLIPYRQVCEIAHRIIFDWSVPNDGNRAAEGKELRDEFMREIGVDPPPDKEWMGLDSSLFEMMIGLCKRCDFYVERGVPGWFDIFMENLGLNAHNDDVIKLLIDQVTVHRRIRNILHRLNDRKYRFDGRGGLFPLKDPPKDQREVELWYQMSRYMAENRMY